MSVGVCVVLVGGIERSREDHGVGPTGFEQSFGMSRVQDRVCDGTGPGKDHRCDLWLELRGVFGHLSRCPRGSRVGGEDPTTASGVPGTLERLSSLM